MQVFGGLGFNHHQTSISFIGFDQPSSFSFASVFRVSNLMRIELTSCQFLASIFRNHTRNVHFTTPMKEIKTKRSSNLSSPLNPDAKCSSSVQSTPEIEKKYVHRVYDAIAPHFSATRFAKWPKVSAFLHNLPSGSVILDVGCGNGKYLGLNPNCFFIGCDISAPLIQICSDRGHEVLVADAVNLPYRNGYGDAAISIAVLHHLSTEHRRKKAIDELVRIVKKGGHVLITVWAVEQEDRSLVNKWTPLTGKYVEEWIGPGSPRVRSSASVTLESIPETEASVTGEEIKDFDCVSQHEQVCVGDKEGERVKQQQYFVPWHLPYHRAAADGASVGTVENGFARKDDQKGAIVYDRYYHVFGEGELERLVSGMKNAVIVDQFYDKSNWCVFLEKTS